MPPLAYSNSNFLPLITRKPPQMQFRLWRQVQHSHVQSRKLMQYDAPKSLTSLCCMPIQSRTARKPGPARLSWRYFKQLIAAAVSAPCRVRHRVRCPCACASYRP
ncbi:predicted protein [Brucella abortus bv. 5 str. B3196]|nr:predicted protein [Brucella abortus bv. 5 str. B3196]